MKKITKKLIKEYLKMKLGNDVAWQKKALIKIYEFQTDDEQYRETTFHNNNIGFTGSDAEILTSITKQYLTKNFISPKQQSIVAKKMLKYWKQILTISDPNKLLQCMVNDNYISKADAFIHITANN